MTKIIIDIFMYIFEFLLFFYYSDSLFPEKKSKAIRFILTFLGVACLGVIYQFNITYLNVILMFIVYTLLLSYLYNISFTTSVFHSLIFIAVMLASEILTMVISSIFFNDFNALENKINAYIFAVLTSKLIYFGIMMIILKLFAQKESNEHQSKYFWLLFIMPFTSIWMLLCFRYITYQMELTRNMSVMWIVSCICALVSNVLVFIIYEYSQKNTKELYELKTIQHQEEQDKKYFEVIDQSNKEMRVFAHDIKNHLTQIRNFDNINAVQAYVDKLVPNVEKFSNTGISKNKMLDLIISKYVTLCESKNIKFDVDVKTANLSYIDDVDLSTLMNNLLDNSIEAVEKTENGYIQVNIFSKSKLYDGLIIKNSCNAPPKAESGELKTTKLDRKSHGIGIKSIKKIIKKYNAVYGWKYAKDKNMFETDIVFPKQSSL